MTVALGLVCSDGVLVAADSMGSDGPIASVSQKVRAFENIPGIWTASGAVYVMEEVTLGLRELDNEGSTPPLSLYTTPLPDAIRKRLHGKVQPIMMKAYSTALNVAPPQPGGLVSIPFATDFLFLGYANGTPWFYELSHDGQVNAHAVRGFKSVGSGGPFAAVAQALMSHYLVTDLTLEQGLMLAYRAIDTTIEVSAAHVGPPVQIAVCDDDGARILTDDELDALKVQVARWKEIERESLTLDATEAAEEAVGDLPTM
jgi:20S proteasome alpha/beta subunit